MTTLLSTLLGLAGCSSQSKLDDQFGPLKTVDTVDIQKFMGTWYVIANIPTFIEEGAHNAIETYTWNEKENYIDVDFRFNKKSFDGAEKSYPQKAFVYNKQTGAEWRIQMFWPLKFAYLIIDLDKDYSYTVIGVPDRSYIWIMARNPTLDSKIIESIKEKMTKTWGYDASKLQMVPQKN